MVFSRKPGQFHCHSYAMQYIFTLSTSLGVLNLYCPSIIGWVTLLYVVLPFLVGYLRN